MLVFADFSNTSDYNRCPVYHAWIHDQLDDKLAQVPQDAKANAESTFRLQTSDRLTLDLDVSRYPDQERD
jgi:hypothetical protein